MTTYDNTKAIQSFKDATNNSMITVTALAAMAKKDDLTAALNKSTLKDAALKKAKLDINVFHDLIQLYYAVTATPGTNCVVYLTSYTMADSNCYAGTIATYSAPSLTAAQYAFPAAGSVYKNILTSGKLFSDAKAGTVNAIFTAENCTPINNFLGTKPTLGFIDNIDKIYQAILAEITGGKPPETDVWVQAYYGQWGCYGTSVPIPLATTNYANLTHFSYGFMGFNPAGEIGSWDAWGDLAMIGCADGGPGVSPTFLAAAGGYAAYGSDWINALWGYTGWEKIAGLGNGGGLSLSAAGGKCDAFNKELLAAYGGDISKAYQMYRLAYAKMESPHIKTLMSFGGWEYDRSSKNVGKGFDTTWTDGFDGSPPAQVFFHIASDATLLAKFVSNIASFIKNTTFKKVTIGSQDGAILWSTPDATNTGDSSKSVARDTSKMDTTKVSISSDDAFQLFDGVDIDWEYPSGCDSCGKCDANGNCPGGWAPAAEKASWTAYANLLTALKGAVPNGPVTTTLGGSPGALKKIASTYTDVITAWNTIDRIGIMTYDFMNGNQVLTHDSPLYAQTISALSDAGSRVTEGDSAAPSDWNADAAVQEIIGDGANQVKAGHIQIGIPYYGRFQYVLKKNINGGAAITQATLTQDFSNKIFDGTTPAFYSSCTQGTPSFECPWVGGETIITSINSINFGTVKDTSCEVCHTRDTKNAWLTPTDAQKTAGASRCSIAAHAPVSGEPGYDNDWCDFNRKLGSYFFSSDDTRVGSTYYLSKVTVKLPSSVSKDATTNSTYAGQDVYIVLSMPSEFSIGQKMAYVKKYGLGGVITWMMQQDPDGTLSSKIKPESLR